MKDKNLDKKVHKPGCICKTCRIHRCELSILDILDFQDRIVAPAVGKILEAEGKALYRQGNRYVIGKLPETVPFEPVEDHAPNCCCHICMKKFKDKAQPEVLKDSMVMLKNGETPRHPVEPMAMELGAIRTLWVKNPFSKSTELVIIWPESKFPKDVCPFCKTKLIPDSNEQHCPGCHVIHGTAAINVVELEAMDDSLEKNTGVIERVENVAKGMAVGKGADALEKIVKARKSEDNGNKD